MAGTISGFTIGYTVAGVVVLYSGLKNTTISATLQSFLAGKVPTAVPETSSTPTETAAEAGITTAAPGNIGASTATAAANQAIAKVLAAPYGWSTGTQWTDLVSLWNQESGWNNTAINPTSGAYGIAQALGHGPTNQYPAGAANPPPNGTSSATAQIAWGLSYIKSAYGSPEAAWAHEVADGNY
jgi:hypothetical protein